MRKLLSVFLILLLSFSLFASDPSVLVPLLFPALIHPADAETELSSLGEEELRVMLLPELLFDGGFEVTRVLTGTSDKIASALVDAVIAAMPYDYMTAVGAEGSVRFSPILDNGGLSAGIAAEYDDASVLYAAEGYGDVLMTLDGRVEVLLSLSSASLFTLSVKADSFVLCGRSITGESEIGVNLDEDAAIAYIEHAGLDADEARSAFASVLLDGMRALEGPERVEAEAMLGVSFEDLAAEDLLLFLSENDLMDLLDLVIAVSVSSETGDDAGLVLWNLLSGYVTVDGERSRMDLEAVIGAAEMLGSL